MSTSSSSSLSSVGARPASPSAYAQLVESSSPSPSDKTKKNSTNPPPSPKSSSIFNLFRSASPSAVDRPASLSLSSQSVSLISPSSSSEKEHKQRSFWKPVSSSSSSSSSSKSKQKLMKDNPSASSSVADAESPSAAIQSPVDSLVSPSNTPSSSPSSSSSQKKGAHKPQSSFFERPSLLDRLFSKKTPRQDFEERPSLVIESPTTGNAQVGNAEESKQNRIGLSVKHPMDFGLLSSGMSSLTIADLGAVASASKDQVEDPSEAEGQEHLEGQEAEVPKPSVEASNILKEPDGVLAKPEGQKEEAPKPLVEAANFPDGVIVLVKQEKQPEGEFTEMESIVLRKLCENPDTPIPPATAIKLYLGGYINEKGVIYHEHATEISEFCNQQINSLVRNSEDQAYAIGQLMSGCADPDYKWHKEIKGKNAARQELLKERQLLDLLKEHYLIDHNNVVINPKITSAILSHKFSNEHFQIVSPNSPKQKKSPLNKTKAISEKEGSPD